MLGFPVNIPMAGGFLAGTAGAKLAASTAAAGTPKQRAIRGVIGGLAGSLMGITTGNITNEIIASANRPRLPTITEYESVQ